MTTGGHGPHRLGQVFVMWLSIYPALTLALWLFEQVGLSQLALPLRTLVLTAVLVPTMVYVLIPGVTSALKRAARVKSSAKS
jgi:antibiotic biosynthesis monooxygenase (ABM) superfamily enzyme